MNTHIVQVSTTTTLGPWKRKGASDMIVSVVQKCDCATWEEFTALHTPDDAEFHLLSSDDEIPLR